MDPQRECDRSPLAKLVPTIVLHEHIQRILNIEEVTAVRSTEPVLELLALLIISEVVRWQLDMENLVYLRLGLDAFLLDYGYVAGAMADLLVGEVDALELAEKLELE